MLRSLNLSFAALILMLLAALRNTTPKTVR